jgi:hypothetical protein
MVSDTGSPEPLVYLLIQLNVSITSVNDMTSAKKMSEKKKNN